MDVVLIDGRLEADPIRRVLAATEGALCLGITVLTGAPIRDALAVSRAVKARHPSCQIVWGGWHPSLFPDECLEEPSIDAVAIGQGEDTMREIVARLLVGESLRGCGGVVARDGSALAKGPPRPLDELDDYPRHDYSLIPVERYFALKGKRQVDYISSQGCRFRCAFCADPAVYARGWTGLSPERIAGEALRSAARLRHGGARVPGRDVLHASAARRRARGRVPGARRRPCDWTATLRADQACRMGEALFAKAVRAGLRRVMVGVEAGSQAMLDRLKKDLRLEQVIDAAELCRRHGVGGIFNFIIGFPGEDDESVEATLALAKRLRSMSPRFETPIFYYRPYPGNPIAEQARSEGYAFPRGLDAWADFDYVGQRGPWVSADALAPRRAVQVLHAPRVAAGRVALAAAHGRALAVRARLVRLPGGKGARRARQTGAASVVMDLLLAHAYFLSEDAEERRIMRPYPPLGILYLSSHLKARGFRVGVFDGDVPLRGRLRASARGTPSADRRHLREHDDEASRAADDHPRAPGAAQRSSSAAPIRRTTRPSISMPARTWSSLARARRRSRN